MPKRREEAGSLSKTKRQKLQRLYKQGGAAYGSVTNLQKASNLSVSKVRQLLHSKLTCTNFNAVTCKFKRIKEIAQFNKVFWCMEFAYVYKLAKYNTGVKYLLFCQDLFDRTVDAKGMTTEYLLKQFVHY